MSNEKKSHSREFKAKVVLEAVSGDHVNPHEIAEKYDLEPGEILSWAHEMDISDDNLEKLETAVKDSEERSESEVDVDIKSETLFAEISYGAAFDKLDMKKLTFWSILGALFVGLIIQSLIWVYDYSKTQTIQQVSERSDFREIRELKLRDEETLSSFGIVDLENRVYRMPIDTVISRMAQED